MFWYSFCMDFSKAAGQKDLQMKNSEIIPFDLPFTEAVEMELTSLSLFSLLF